MESFFESKDSYGIILGVQRFLRKPIMKATLECLIVWGVNY